jgi:two-component system capsular synthesis response regulator RcsB
MKLDQTPHPAPTHHSFSNACDDTPVSHRHRPHQPLRIILADDHPVVLREMEVALRAPSESAFSIVALATNPDE